MKREVGLPESGGQAKEGKAGWSSPLKEKWKRQDIGEGGTREKGALTSFKLLLVEGQIIFRSPVERGLRETCVKSGIARGKTGKC